MNSDAELIYNFLSAPGPVPDRADVIIALGTYDLRVADYAAEVYLSGKAPLLICSGGLGKLTGSLFTRPEAELFAERCHALGVPQEKLVIEPASTNTGENFRFSRKLLSSRGIHPATGIAVSKPYMAKRAWATGTMQWPEVQWSVMTQPLTLEDYGADDRTIALMVGDLQRLRVYAEKGFQAPVEVPDEIWAAYERLAAAGYDRYVIR
ncbi:MAG: YdcF family protein [Oscillospiraceae bacterium]|nr:YdcF family protein [Oscillospiraceae bacterium]